MNHRTNYVLLLLVAVVAVNQSTLTFGRPCLMAQVNNQLCGPMRVDKDVVCNTEKKYCQQCVAKFRNVCLFVQEEQVSIHKRLSVVNARNDKFSASEPATFYKETSYILNVISFGTVFQKRNRRKELLLVVRGKRRFFCTIGIAK